MTDLTTVNVAVIRAEARAAWENDAKQKTGVQERIGASVHWWLVIVAAVFFALSAPHTAAIFNAITPVVGMIAPLGVEFGLLYAAFRRKKATETSENVPKTLWAMEVLLIIVSFAVNGAGAATAAMHGAGLEELSLAQVMDRFGALPFPTQVILFIAVLSAFFIPVGTLVAGEGLAALFLERRAGGGLLELKWQKDGARVEFAALQAAALMAGATPAKAAQWANGIVNGGVSLAVAPLVAPASDSVAIVRLSDLSDSDASGQNQTVRQSDSRTKSDAAPRRVAAARGDKPGERVWKYLSDHPDAAAMTVRELAEAVGVSPDTANRVQRTWKLLDEENKS